MKEIAKMASDRENNHTASRRKHHINKVRRFLLNISTSNYLHGYLVENPIQTLIIRRHIVLLVWFTKRAWAACVHNRLLINDAKIEFLILGSRHQLSKILIDSITVGDSTIHPLESVPNLGSWFDATMSIFVHIGKICSKAFHGLYRIRQIRKFLSPETTKTLVHAFVASYLDYCNSLLYGVPKY